jgi:prepilin-type N-terminal cleavage/methylation domain-containing protein
MSSLLHTNKYQKRQRGFTLVETLVAITILLVVIVGPMTIAQKGMQSAYYAGDQTTAIYLAQEAIEHIQKLRDEVALVSFEDYRDGTNDDVQNTRSWHTNLDSDCKDGVGCDINFATGAFRDCGSNECRLNEQTTVTDRIYGYGAGSASPYTRVIRVGGIDAQGGVSVSVQVSWAASLFNSATKSVTLQTYIYDHYSRFE